MNALGDESDDDGLHLGGEGMMQEGNFGSAGVYQNVLELGGLNMENHVPMTYQEMMA
jgi:hypothetical protein